MQTFWHIRQAPNCLNTFLWSCRRYVLYGVLLLCALLACPPDTAAQEPHVLNILVADFTSPNARQTDRLPMQARDAVAGELATAGQAQFHLLPRAQIVQAAKTLGMRLPKDPLQPSELTQDDWFRLGREVKADALVTGDVSTRTDGKKGQSVAVNILVRDVNDGDALNGAQTRQTVTPREGELDEEALVRSVSDAVGQGVREMLARPQVLATVITVRVKNITLNRGRRDGLHAGDELRTYRYGANGSSVSTGKVRITKIAENDAEALIVISNGIGPEDVARLLYRVPSPARK